jgi:hypothetical protein
MSAGHAGQALWTTEISEWFDWLRKDLSMGGISLPDEESAVHLIYHSLRLSDRVREICHLPEPLREKFIQSSIVYQCWKLQRDQVERAGLPPRRSTLNAVKAIAYIRRIGSSGLHHLVEGEDGFKYVVTIPSGLWVESLPAVEIVCCEAARLLGLSVPAAAIVALSPEMLTQADRNRPDWDRAKLRVAVRNCCGFRYVEKCGERFSITQEASRDLGARTQILGRIVFNVWVGNYRADRVIFLPDDGTGRVRPVFYDHSKCFFGDGIGRFAATDLRTQLCPKVRLSVHDEYEILVWVRKVRELDMNPLWDLLVEMPPGWYGGFRGRIGEALQVLEAGKMPLLPAMRYILDQELSGRVRRHSCKREWGCPQALACDISGRAQVPVRRPRRAPVDPGKWIDRAAKC